MMCDAYVLIVFLQRVIELQASKNQLAGVLLSPHDGDKTDDSLGSLYVRYHGRIIRILISSQRSTET